MPLNVLARITVGKVCPCKQEILGRGSVPWHTGDAQREKCVPHAGEDQRESVLHIGDAQREKCALHTGDAQREKCAPHTGHPRNVAA